MVSLEELIAAHSSQKGCVISCSVLKREHRKKLASHIDHEMDWVFMKGYFDKAVHRVEQNGGQNRPASSLKSDFESLEIPKMALTIDMNNSEQEMVDIILKYLALKYG
jgi:6-phosphogluconate dehydrogenase/gluconokinase